MSQFRSHFKRGPAVSLVRQFGEPVVYFPNGGVNGRSINAIVERNVEIPSETGEQVAKLMVVRVIDSSTLGISSTEINSGKDVIALPLHVGGSVVRREITRLVDDSNGMLRFTVR